MNAAPTCDYGPAVADEIAFTTSGHTNGPQPWWRTRQQLLHEVDVVTDTLLDPGWPVYQIVSFAPPRHLFGYLFAQLLPQRRGVPVLRAWQQSPAEIAAGLGYHALIITVPHAWELLRRVSAHTDALRNAIALHSTAAPPPAAAEVLATWCPRGFAAHEILGSTETGAIAHRAMGGMALTRKSRWTLFRDVELLGDDHGLAMERPLQVRSPRLARRDGADSPPASIDTGDLIRPDSQGGFDLSGRTSGLVKINGRRTDLTDIEVRLARYFPSLDLACIRVADPLRGEHYALCYRGKSNDHEPSLAELRGPLGELPAPRAVHRVPHIPRSASGKVHNHELRQLAGLPVPTSGESQ
jgi:acyl-coenzyme A synthetase/AMP-(fatty) acid ligase